MSLLKILYRIYNKRFSSEFIDGYHKRIAVRLANSLFRISCRLRIGSRRHSITESENLNSNDKYIVSLTSFPKRIGYVWMAIESILRQTSKPDAIILWLTEEEFKSKKFLPKSLLNLQKRGVQIRFAEDNLMPHNKYFFTLKNYPKANIITVDDDIIYSPFLIEDLKKYLKKYPASICSTITRTIKVEDNVVQPYKEWNEIDDHVMKSHKFLQLGVGGVIYPPGSLHKEVLNKKIIKEHALKADDLWLKVMSVKNNTEVVNLPNASQRKFLPLIIKDNEQLMDSNIKGGQNDKILRAILDYYELPASVFSSQSRKVFKKRFS